MNMDEIELELIDYGLEELAVNDEIAYLEGEFTAFGNLTTAVDKLDIQNVKANLQRKPTSPIELQDQQIEEIELLIDKIEDDDDVQAVFTNIA